MCVCQRFGVVFASTSSFTGLCCCSQRCHLFSWMDLRFSRIHALFHSSPPLDASSPCFGVNHARSSENMLNIRTRHRCVHRHTMMAVKQNPSLIKKKRRDTRKIAKSGGLEWSRPEAGRALFIVGAIRRVCCYDEPKEGCAFINLLISAAK